MRVILLEDETLWASGLETVLGPGTDSRPLHLSLPLSLSQQSCSVFRTRQTSRIELCFGRRQTEFAHSLPVASRCSGLKAVPGCREPWSMTSFVSPRKRCRDSWARGNILRTCLVAQDKFGPDSRTVFGNRFLVVPEQRRLCSATLFQTGTSYMETKQSVNQQLLCCF